VVTARVSTYPVPVPSGSTWPPGPPGVNRSDCAANGTPNANAMDAPHRRTHDLCIRFVAFIVFIVPSPSPWMLPAS
jgi:hypothetical protein